MSGRRAAERTAKTMRLEHGAWMRKELGLPYHIGPGRHRKDRSPFNLPAWPFNQRTTS